MFVESRQVFFVFFHIKRLTVADQKPKAEGTVIEALPDTKFKVKLDDEREVLSYLSGKMRMHYIKVMIGDRVTVELSPDGTRGRIVYRK